MDDGGGVLAGQTRLHLWQCDVYNPNQHFEYMLLPGQVLPTNVPARPVTPSVTETTPYKSTTDGGSTDVTTDKIAFDNRTPRDQTPTEARVDGSFPYAVDR